MRNMLKDRRVTLVLVLILALVLVCIVARYVAEPIVFKYRLDRLRERCLAQSNGGRAQQAKIPEGLLLSPFQGLLYVPDQLILTGPRSTISTTIGTLELKLEPKGEIGLSYSLEQKQIPSDLAKPHEVAIQLYQSSDSKTVEQMVCEINGLKNIRSEFTVFADPNYHVSPAGWGGGGSPWTQNGEWAEDGGGLGSAPSEDFLSQWALGPDGIELFDARVRTTDYMGDGIRVAVFDTSPFDDVPDNGTSVKSIPWVTPTLTLTVRHHELVPAENCPGRDRQEPCIDREKQDISNHGLFVAGLVHAVAPHSEIHLIRVLENDGCGDLFAIVSALNSFIEEALKEKKTLTGTVINLSLGVHQPPNPKTFGLPKEVVALQRIVQKAIDHGAVVVAASGNDSYDKLPPDESPSSMEIPANAPSVIGVAASSIERKRGCFSNEGNVAAPGGNGINPCEVPGKVSGETSSDSKDEGYWCQKKPSLCLISLVHRPAPGYAYWVGTSFSTPLVSGLAALMLEKEEIIFSESLVNVATIISTTITAGACPPATPPTPHHLGAGIVNVRHTMQRAACPPTP